LWCSGVANGRMMTYEKSTKDDIYCK
jgi:hypothetical protein